MNIFKYNNYKAVISSFISENIGTRGYQSRLAEVAKCQRSHFSLVLKSHHHLSPEQVLRLADYWGLSDLEAEYVLCLLDLAKASSERFVRRCNQRLKQLQDQAELLSKRFEVEGHVSESHALTYYGHWYYQAVHALLSIPTYKKAQDLSVRLSIPIGEINRIINDLLGMGLVEKNGAWFRVKAKNIHIAKDSPLNWVNHHNWRQRAVADSQNMKSNGLHYSAVYALSQSSQEELKNEVYSLLAKTREIALKSSEEEVYVFACDWFSL